MAPVGTVRFCNHQRALGRATLARQWAVAALLCCMLAFLVYLYKSAETDLFEAQAKILLLAPQDQYLPSIDAAQTGSLLDGIADQNTSIRSFMTDPDVMSGIITQHQLYQDPHFSEKNLWQRGLEAFGLGGFQTNGSSLVAKRIQDSTQIDYRAERRLLSIAFRAPDPAQATAIANSLARFYLHKVKLDQTRAFDVAVEKLNADVHALRVRLQKTNDEMVAQDPAIGLSKDQISEWTKLENQRIAQLKQKATAEYGMLNHMLSRYHEAQTKRSLDLLPPQARLIARATTPVQPVASSALVQAGLSGMLVFSVLILLIGIISLRAKRSQKRGAVGTMMPQPVLWSIAQQPEQEGTHERLSCPVANPTYDPSQQWPDALSTEVEVWCHDDCLIDHVAGVIYKSSHKRVVFMSDEEGWGGNYTPLVKRLATSGTSLVSICLGAAPSSLNANADEHSVLGMSDLVDGKAACADVVWVDEETGVHTVEVGTRRMVSEDFFSHDFHAFLLALESTYDLLLIDIGPHFDDEFALKSLGLARDVQACIYAPDTDRELSHQVHDVMRHFGYISSMILPLDMSAKLYPNKQVLGMQAAE